MNYDIFEQYLTGYCLLRPQHLSLIDLNIIKRKSFRDILTLATELRNIDNRPILSIALKAKLHSNNSFNILPMDIDIVYDLITKELVNKSETEIKNEISNILDYLQKRYSRNETIAALQKAIKLIEEGKETEGILQAKTIKFSNASPLKLTSELMLESVDETNIFLTGIPSLDKNLNGLAKGNMMSIAGDTGSMKTMISIWLCLSILKANPTFKCLYFEKEMPVKDVARRLAANLTGISITEMMKDENRESNKCAIISGLSEDGNVKSILDRLLIVPNNAFSTVSDMFKYIESYKADIWCLDFLTQLGAENLDSDFNRFTMAQAAMLKNVIIETDTFGIVLNQIKKGSARSRKNKIPIMDDIEWSGTISQYSAYIFSSFFPSLYYEDAPKDYFYLYGLKNRHHKPVNINLITNPAYCQFADPPDGQKMLLESWLHGYITKNNEVQKYGR